MFSNAALVMLIAAAGVIVLMVWAAMRDRLVHVIMLAVAIIALPIALAALVVEQLVETLRSSETRCRDGLAYRVRSEGAPVDTSDVDGWKGWDLIGPLVYAICFGILAIGAWYLESLRLGALFQLEDTTLAFGGRSPQSLTGIVLTTCVAVWALVTFDVWGMSPLRRPFATQSWLKRMCLTGFALSIALGVFLFVYGQVQLERQADPLLAYIVVALFGVLLFGALALSGWAALPVIVVVLIGVIWILRVFLEYLVLWPLMGLFKFLDALGGFLCAVVDVPADLGRGLWNWLVKLAPEGLQLGVIPEPKDRSTLDALFESIGLLPKRLEARLHPAPVVP